MGYLETEEQMVIRYFIFLPRILVFLGFLLLEKEPFKTSSGFQNIAKNIS